MNNIDLQKVADGAEFNRFHGMVLFWSLLILILDGYDLAVVGAALPAIMKDMNVDAAKAGFMVSSALFGMMIGAISLGTLADKIGRPVVVSVCIALFSVFTAAAGLTRDPLVFGILRFLAGLGIGGALPIMTAQMAEFAPIKLRARLVTLACTGYSIGGVLVALVGKQLIETYGWQSVFFAAIVPIVIIPFLLRTMPQSMVFLMRKNRESELRMILTKVLPGYVLRGNETFIPSPETRASEAPVASLFQEGRAISTLLIWLAFFMGLFMVYALSSWLTKLMAMAGYSLGSALTFVLVYNIGAIVGALLGGWLSDKFNIKGVLVLYYFVGAISLILMGYTKSTDLLFIAVFVVGASTLGTLQLAYAYAGGFYPSAIRTTGIGFASGMGRMGGIVAPVLIGWLVSLALPLEQNFIAIGLAGVIGTIAVMFVDQKRRVSVNRSAPDSGSELAG